MGLQAFSLNAQEFEYYPQNPIFNGTQAFNNLAVVTPSVLLEDGQFKMWYGGRAVGYPVQLGYAVSENGIDWTEAVGPVMAVGPTGSFDANGIERFSVVNHDGLYKLWYSGRNAEDQYAIGYATSPDGITWTRSSDNPVIVTGETGTWNETKVRAPAVVVHNDVFYMWLHGLDGDSMGSIGLYTSSDGVEWVEFANNPVIEINPELQWESTGINLQTVIKRQDGSFLMMYGGSENGVVQLGLASSQDGVNWTRLSDTPTVPVGEPGSWDALFVGGPSLVAHSSNHYGVWYTGHGGGNVWNIGYGDLWMGLPGDINEDHQLTISDVIVLISVILGESEVSPEAETLGDMNSDTFLSIQDVILLVEAILGDGDTI